MKDKEKISELCEPVLVEIYKLRYILLKLRW